MAQADSTTVDITALVTEYERRANRVYRWGLLLRVALALASLLALLPDSSLLPGGDSRAYAAVTSLAAPVAAFLLVLVRGLRFTETLKHCAAIVDYLQSKQSELMTRDGLSRRLAAGEIRREVAAREAQHRQGVFQGLDELAQLGQKPSSS